MSESEIDVIAKPEHTASVTLLQRVWIVALLLQLGVIAFATSLVPKYATGTSSFSLGTMVAITFLIALGFWAIARWERAMLLRIPAEIADTTPTAMGVRHQYVFVDSDQALHKAIAATTAPTLLRFALALIITFVALGMRHLGSSLVFVTVLMGFALLIEWRVFPSLKEIAEKLEREKGVKLSSIPPPSAVVFELSSPTT